jgi:hypothetical protein
MITLAHKDLLYYDNTLLMFEQGHRAARRQIRGTRTVVMAGRCETMLPAWFCNLVEQSLLDPSSKEKGQINHHLQQTLFPNRTAGRKQIRTWAWNASRSMDTADTDMTPLPMLMKSPADGAFSPFLFEASYSSWYPITWAHIADIISMCFFCLAEPWDSEKRTSWCVRERQFVYKRN